MDSKVDNIIDKLDVTDLTLVQLLYNQNYLENIVKAFDNSILYYSQNKDFFFNFKCYVLNTDKTYSAGQLLSLIKAYNEKRISHDLSYYFIKISGNNKQINLDMVDKSLLILYISKYSYLKLYKMLEKARLYRSNVGNFNFTYTAPLELFGDIPKKSYDAANILILAEMANSKMFNLKYNKLGLLQVPYLLKKVINN